MPRLPATTVSRPAAIPIGDDVRVPAGVAIRDEQRFAAAERVLLRHGPDGLTSRAVITEAGGAVAAVRP